MNATRPQTTEEVSMTVWIALAGFVVVVAMLAALNSRRTGGRACCAPADPAADLRMRDSLNHDPTWDEEMSRD